MTNPTKQALIDLRDKLANAGLRVKPLVWDDYPAIDGPVLSISNCAFGTYFISDDTDDFSGLYCELVQHKGATWYGTVKAHTDVITQCVYVDDLEPLKAAAQADYETRILSALIAEDGS